MSIKETLYKAYGSIPKEVGMSFGSLGDWIPSIRGFKYYWILLIRKFRKYD